MQSLGVFRDPIDDSIKCVFDVGNNQIIEMTLLKNRSDTDVICVPTHHFCNLGCKMCHLTNNALNKFSKCIDYKDFSLALGLTTCYQQMNAFGNLVATNRRTEKNKLLLSFMGVGEPLLNFELLERVHQNIPYIKQILGYENVGMALATMMPNKNLKTFTPIINDNNIHLKIHFSLHNPIDHKRSNLIPASIISVTEAMNILKDYETIVHNNKNIMNEYNKLHKTNDVVEIHYTLIEGVNDGNDELQALCDILNDYKFTIKFIRFNPKDELKISNKEQCWVDTIKSKCDVRVKTYCPPGKNIGSSCGEFTKHYYHMEIETEEEKKEFLDWKQKYEVKE